MSLFSSLLLLKEIRTRVESKISSCCFCVSCKWREFGGRGSPRFPCVTPVVESSSDLLRAIITISFPQKNSTTCKSHRKTLVPESFFNKVAGLRPATLLNKRLWDKCFTVNFVKILRIPFFLEHNPVAACVQLYRIWITQRHSSIFFFSGRTYKYKKITRKMIKAFKHFLRKLHLKINKSLRTFLTHPSSVVLLQILFDHFKREI